MNYDPTPIPVDECHGEGIIGGTGPGDYNKPKGLKIDDPAENARIAKYGKDKDDEFSDEEVGADRDYRGREINKRIPNAAKTLKELLHLKTFSDIGFKVKDDKFYLAPIKDFI